MFGSFTLGAVAFGDEIPTVVTPATPTFAGYRGPRCIWYWWGAR